MNLDAEDYLVNQLACMTCHNKLEFNGSEFFCRQHPDAMFQVCRGIPRFVRDDNYVDSFSFEWQTHNRTQLDVFNNDNSSEKQFSEKTGFTRDDLKDKLVLDAGVGAGRYTDVMSRWGAKVIGVDLSYAVEAAHNNFKKRSNVLILQSDIASLPLKLGVFDVIISIGVLHHTPNTKEYFNYLIPLLKPGGVIAIWVYPKQEAFVIRKKWIPYTSRIPSKMFYAWCRWFVPYAKKHPHPAFNTWLRRFFPISEQGLGLENDILDTFDGYSPTFHGVHSPDEVITWFREAGLSNIHCPSDWETCVKGTMKNEA